MQSIGALPIFLMPSGIFPSRLAMDALMDIPSQNFEVIGRTLFGAGPGWKQQYAHALNIRTDSVDAMAKGRSRIPPGVWLKIAGLIQDAEREAAVLLPRMKVIALELADPPGGGAKVVAGLGAVPAVVGASPSSMGGPIQVMPPWTEEDKATLQAGLDVFARSHGTSFGTVFMNDRRFSIEVPGILDDAQLAAFRDWLRHEADRLRPIILRRSGASYIPVITGPDAR